MKRSNISKFQLGCRIFAGFSGQSFFKAAKLILWVTFAATVCAAQTVPHVTGTFKTPGNQTPSQAGLRSIATIGTSPGVAVYGTADFTPYDSADNIPNAILCGGVTYIPQTVRAWIAQDGTLVDNTGSAGVSLIPEVGCSPTGLVMRVVITFAPSADGRVRSVTWTEEKQLPQTSSVDWGSLSLATTITPAFSYVQENEGVVNDYVDFKLIAAPGNPASGYGRIFGNSSNNLFSCLTSTGGNCSPAGGGGTPCTTTALSLQFNNAGSFGCVTQLTYSGSTVSLLSGGTFDTTAGTVKVPGTPGQLLYVNNSNALAAEDPIVSYNYANLINAQAATAQVTGSAVRVSTFGQYGTLYFTFASITGSPSGCGVQIKSYDSLGDGLNNGGAISVTPANGVTSATFSPAAGLNTAAQMSATFSCGTYPTAGTISVDFVPSLTAYIPGTVSATFPSPQAVTQSGIWNMRNQDASGNGLTSNSTTYTSKFGLDANLLGTLGTAFSTPGKVDVIGTITAQMQTWNGSSWINAGSWPADNSAFTAGTTGVGVIGGWYSASPTNCTSGNLCAPQLTIDRKLFVQAFQGTSPWLVTGTGGTFPVTGTFWQTTQPVSCTTANCSINLGNWDGTALGTPTNFGTTPGAVIVGGVNASLFAGTTALSQTGGSLNVNITGGGGSGGGPADAAANAAASESDAARQKVTSALRLLDTTQSAGSQLVTAKGDQTSGLWVNCKSGCAGGTFNNNSDAVATSSTNGQSAAWLYGFNGTTFDRLRDDANKYLFVDLGTALPAGSNLIGGVNLSQVGASAFSLGQQLAASSLPVVLTAAQLSTLTGANMSGTAPGTAPSNTTVVGTIYNGSQPTPTSGQTLPLQSDGAGNLYVNVASGTVSLTNPATVEGQYHVAFPSLTDGQASTLLLDQKGHLDIDVSRMSQQPISTAAPGTQLVGVADGIGSPLTSTKSVLDVNVKTASDVFPAAANGRSGPNGFSPTFSESMGCEYSPLLPALTLGQSAPCQSDALGRILVNVAAMPSLGIKGVADAAGTQMSFDPCQGFAHQYFNVNTSSNVQIAAGSPGKYFFICGAMFPPQAAAANVAFVESATAGNACATSPAGMMGGSTAGTGANLATNGGFGMPVTGYSYTHTFTPGDSICLAISSGTVEGVIVFVGPI